MSKYLRHEKLYRIWTKYIELLAARDIELIQWICTSSSEAIKVLASELEVTPPLKKLVEDHFAAQSGKALVIYTNDNKVLVIVEEAGAAVK